MQQRRLPTSTESFVGVMLYNPAGISRQRATDPDPMHPSVRPSPSRNPPLRSLSGLLVGGVVATLLLAGFLSLGSEMLEGDTRALDQAVLHAMKDLRGHHPWLVEVMRDLSGVGSTVVLTLVTVVTVAYLSMFTAMRFAMLVAASVISGSLLMTLLKGLFGRLRPDAAYADAAVTGLSFPSGHATMSAVVYLTLGALLASTCTQRGQRGYIVGVAAMMALLVGVSRVALGVHWATDVVAGWAFGSGWALLWLLLASRLIGPPGGAATSAS